MTASANLATLLADAAAAHPGRIGIVVEGGGQTTYAEIARAAEGARAVLDDVTLGLPRRRDRRSSAPPTTRL